ncbi:hypothetical protein CA983_13270 [Streptomyces swartbergensis]|uniref:Uncharacterized protein n=1 Tax=Streptomyces swartbergensis TaxID=487165 RepID=A0A243S746_9ACTN|nr:hypothetical protein CA983_13270 [Streptomyces swartbergensis]
MKTRSRADRYVMTATAWSAVMFFKCLADPGRRGRPLRARDCVGRPGFLCLENETVDMLFDGVGIRSFNAAEDTVLFGE